MDAKKNKQLCTKEEFNSKIKELYANSAEKPVAELRRAVAEFYSKFTADEDTLFERYRELKYQLEQSCPIGLSMYVSVFTSVFVASAVKYIEESVLLKGLDGCRRIINVCFGQLRHTAGKKYLYEEKDSTCLSSGNRIVGAAVATGYECGGTCHYHRSFLPR